MVSNLQENRAFKFPPFDLTIQSSSSTTTTTGPSTVDLLMTRTLKTISLKQPPPSTGSYCIKYQVRPPVRLTFPFDQVPIISSPINPTWTKEMMDNTISRYVHRSIERERARGARNNAVKNIKIVVDIVHRNITSISSWDDLFDLVERYDNGKYEKEKRGFINGMKEEDKEENMCSICHDTMVEGFERVARLRCCHRFHMRCILEWLQEKNLCPYCRARIKEISSF